MSLGHGSIIAKNYIEFHWDHKIHEIRIELIPRIISALNYLISVPESDAASMTIWTKDELENFCLQCWDDGSIRFSTNWSENNIIPKENVQDFLDAFTALDLTMKKVLNNG